VQVFCGTLSVTTAARLLKRMRKRTETTKLSAAVEEWFLLQAAELGVPASVEQHSVVRFVCFCSAVRSISTLLMFDWV
jgi:hypothetical protein